MLLKTNGLEEVVVRRQVTTSYWVDEEITPNPITPANPNEGKVIDQFVGASIVPCLRDGRYGFRLMMLFPDGTSEVGSECLINESLG